MGIDICLAHILRETTGINEYDPHAAADGWADDLLTLLGDAHRWVAYRRERGHTGLPAFKQADLADLPGHPRLPLDHP